MSHFSNEVKALLILDTVVGHLTNLKDDDVRNAYSICIRRGTGAESVVVLTQLQYHEWCPLHS